MHRIAHKRHRLETRVIVDGLVPLVGGWRGGHPENPIGRLLRPLRLPRAPATFHRARLF